MKNLLPLLADWVNGMFAVLIVSYWFGVDPTWWYFLIGIMLAMSPDIDAIPELLVRRRVAASSEHVRDHRTFLHYPIIALPVGVIAMQVFGYWGAVWFVALGLHLVNDLYGTGWGLALLYPLSTRHFKFFARRVNQMPFLLQASGRWEDLSLDERRVRVLASWTKAELPIYITQYGMDDWIRHCYLTFNPIAITEYALFGLALTLTVVSLL